MDIDIVRKIKITELKASFENLKLSHRFFFCLFLFSLIVGLAPHAALAQQTESSPAPGPVLIFDTGNSDYEDYLDQRTHELTEAYYQEQVRQQAIKQKLLAGKVAEYLRARKSPLAEYAETLVSVRNWKKIVALSNAESTLCRRYPTHLANCWGIGGADMWDMGDNLGQGVISMNHFLNNYPRRSTVKYAEMSFERMNGLYKQPPADHWVRNNKSVYDDMVAIEKSLD